MRFRLVLAVNGRENGTLLPCNYQYELSSWVYKVLNDGNAEFTNFLHNQGFITVGKKSFKLFTFSHLDIPRFKIFDDRLNILCDQVQLIVSFCPIDAIDAFVVGLFKDRRLLLGDRKSQVSFDVVSVERQPDVEFTPVMQFRTLSPIFIDERNMDSRKTNHLSPTALSFSDLLHYNLLEKYRAFYQKEPDPTWPITQIRVLSTPKSKVIAIKKDTQQENQLRGYMCQFELTGEPELLRLGYLSGFGRLGSQGFGCVEAMKNM